MNMHINKVHHVTTINRVAEELGEDQDWLRDVANEMDVEDGVIWVYGVGDGVMAFTDFGIENLMDSSRCAERTSSGVEIPKHTRLRPTPDGYCVAAQPTGRKCLVKRLFLDHAATRNIDQKGRWLHSRKFGFTDQPISFDRIGSHDDDIVTFREHRI